MDNKIDKSHRESLILFFQRNLILLSRHDEGVPYKGGVESIRQPQVVEGLNKCFASLDEESQEAGPEEDVY